MLDDDAVLTAPSHQLPRGPLRASSPRCCDNGALHRLEAFGMSLLLHPATVAEAGLDNVHLRVTGRTASPPAPARPGQRLRRRASVRPRGRRRGHHGRTSTTALPCASAPSTRRWHWILEVTNTRDEPRHGRMPCSPTTRRSRRWAPCAPTSTTSASTSTSRPVNDDRPRRRRRRAPEHARRARALAHGRRPRQRQVLGDRRPPARRAHPEAACAWRGLDAPDLPSRASSTSTRSSRCRTSPTELAPARPTAPASGASARRTTRRRPRTPTHAGPTSAGEHCTRIPPTELQASSRRSPTAEPGNAVVVAAPPSPSRAARPCRARRAGLLAGRTPRRDGRRRHASSPGPCRGGQLVTRRQGARASFARTATCSAPATRSPPTRRSLASTVWMAGTFHSQITRGHVGRNPVVTGRRTYLGLQRAHGVAPLRRGQRRTAGRCSRRRARGSPASTTARGGMPPPRVHGRP